MAARKKVIDCPIREVLAAQFSRHLDNYNQTFSALLDKMTPDAVIDETKSLYESCREARNALQEHKRDHGC